MLIIKLHTWQRIGRLLARTEAHVLVKPSTRARLDELEKTVRRSVELIDEINVDIAVQRVEAERLWRDVENAKHLAALTDEQRKALTAEIIAIVRPETDRGIKASKDIAVLGFLAATLVAVGVALYAPTGGGLSASSAVTPSANLASGAPSTSSPTLQTGSHARGGWSRVRLPDGSIGYLAAYWRVPQS